MNDFATQRRVWLLAGLILLLAGCTSRGLTITSTPPGAEVTINRRLVGYTPVRVGFTHYGTYRMELRQEGYQTLVKEESINPPAYGYDPISFASDNVIPARLTDELYFHYILKTLEIKPERTQLLERAALARQGQAINPKTGDHFTIEFPGSHGTPEIPAIQVPEAATATTTAPLKPTVESPLAEKPVGPRLGQELGITPETTPATEQKTAKAPEKKTETPPQPERTPKEEKLLYQQPKIEDPEKK